jgi:hypothetical protein
MKEGAEFPPVTLFYDGTDYWLADGFHRVEAAFGAGLTEIVAEVKQGTRRDAILYSVGANAAHGLRRNNADKRRAVITLLDDAEWSNWTNVAIAKACGVAESFVRKLKKECHIAQCDVRTYQNKHGEIAQMNTANIGKKVSSPSRERNEDDVTEDNSLPEANSPLIDSPQPETDPPGQSLKIGQLVTVTGDHIRAGQSGYVTALPNLSTAIIEFIDGERELLRIENLKPEADRCSVPLDEKKANSSKFYPNEGINYRPGLGCEWYVRVEEETWNQLLKYQAKEGTATLNGAIKRLLSLAKEVEYFSNNTEL